MKRRIDISIACDTPNELGESPIWSSGEGCLYWVDIAGQAIHRLTGQGRHDSWAMGSRVGAVGLRHAGGLVATKPDGLYAVALEGSKARCEPIVQPTLPPGARLKEGKVDRNGRYWCGSTGATRQDRHGALFRLTPDGSFRELDRGFMLVNGIAFDAGGTRLLMADSPDDLVYAYELDAGSGSVANRRVFFSSAGFPGVPDGATFDEEGCYWCAFIYDGAVGRIDPAGRLDRLVRLPVRNPTMCAFGGPNLDVLYVTSARTHLSEVEKAAQPQAGMLFAVSGLGVHGLVEPAFGFGS